MSSNTNLRNDWLDLCRAMAILGVLLSHGRHFLTPFLPEVHILKVGGFLGVELFFVLSGFLIGRILIDQVATQPGAGWIVTFWFRRWARTLPAYWVFIALNMLLAIAGWRVAELTVEDLLRYLTFTQNLTAPHPGFMGEAWSLSVEELFYLFTPVFMAGIAMLFPQRSSYLAVTFAILAASSAARIAVTLSTDRTFDEGLRKIALLRLDAIAIGLLLAYYHKHFQSWSRIKWVGCHVLGLGCLFLAGVFAALSPTALDNNLSLKLLIFPLASIGSAAFISFGLRWALPRRISSIAAAMAAVSYSAYLANLPVFASLQTLLGGPTAPLQGIMQLLLFLAGTLVVATLSRILVEKPVLAWRDRKAILPSHLPPRFA